MKELLEKINEEMRRWQEYYNKVELHLYPIMTACFRAEGVYAIEEEKTPTTQLFERIDQLLMSTEDDTECLNAIYSIVITYLGEDFIKELQKSGEGRELAKLTVAEALGEIEDQLIARQHINDESLIAMRTLQWVREQIKEEA